MNATKLENLGRELLDDSIGEGSQGFADPNSMQPEIKRVSGSRVRKNAYGLTVFNRDRPVIYVPTFSDVTARLNSTFQQAYAPIRSAIEQNLLGHELTEAYLHPKSTAQDANNEIYRLGSVKGFTKYIGAVIHGLLNGRTEFSTLVYGGSPEVRQAHHSMQKCNPGIVDSVGLFLGLRPMRYAETIV